MGHVTRQVELISAAVTHSTSTDSLYTTRLPDNLGPIRSGPDSRSRTVTRYCNKENIRRMTLQLCYFRSRGNILRFPLWTTAAHLCQLHHSLSSPTRRSTNFSNPSAIIDCFTLRPTHGSSTTLCPGPHAGSTGTARTLPKPRARPSATLALLSTPGLPILASGGLGSSALHPRFAHSGLRRGSDLLASHRLHSDSVSPARPRQPGSGPGRLGPEPDRAGKARTRLRMARCAYGSRVPGSAHLGTGRPGPARPGTGPGRLGPGPTSTSPGSPKAAGPRWQLSHSPGERTKVPGPRGDRPPALRGGPASSSSINRGTGIQQAPRAVATGSAAKTRTPLTSLHFLLACCPLHHAPLLAVSPHDQWVRGAQAAHPRETLEPRGVG